MSSESRLAIRAIDIRKRVCGELCASEQRLLDDVHPDDRRVHRFLASVPGIGSWHRFLASLPSQSFTPKIRLTLDELVKRVCEQTGVSSDELRTPLKNLRLSFARAELARQVIEGRVASLHEVGRYLGRDPSGLSRLLAPPVTNVMMSPPAPITQAQSTTQYQGRRSRLSGRAAPSSSGSVDST